MCCCNWGDIKSGQMCIHYGVGNLNQVKEGGGEEGPFQPPAPVQHVGLEDFRWIRRVASLAFLVEVNICGVLLVGVPAQVEESTFAQPDNRCFPPLSIVDLSGTGKDT